MKKLVWVMVVGFLFGVPALAQAQVDKMLDRILQKGEQRGEIRPEDLSIVQMEFSPDPVRQGQQLSVRRDLFLNRSFRLLPSFISITRSGLQDTFVCEFTARFLSVTAST